MKEFLIKLVLGLIGLPTILLGIYAAIKFADWLSTTDFILWVIAGILGFLVLLVCYHVGDLIHDIAKSVREETRNSSK